MELKFAAEYPPVGEQEHIGRELPHLIGSLKFRVLQSRPLGPHAHRQAKL